MTQSLIPEMNPMISQMSDRAKAFAAYGTRANDEIGSEAIQRREAMAQQQAQQGGDSSWFRTENGYGNNVPMSLIQSESGGNWEAQNSETGHGGKSGHYGAAQFGHARLQDAMNAGVIPKGMTPEQFMSNPDAQIATTNWHFNDIDKNIRSAGYDKMVGQTVGGVPISMDGMRSMAHLGGFGGLSRFMSSGGRYNPSDSFGTSLSMYGNQHRS